MDKYKEINLGAEAITYIKKVLSLGCTLSSYVLQNVDLWSVKVVTGLPESANFDKINDFEAGLILPQVPESKWIENIGEDGKKSTLIPIPIYTAYLFEKIKNYLESHRGGLCIFENANAKPSDPILRHYKSRIWFFHDEVYHILGEGKHPFETIERVISEYRSSLNFVGFMTSLPENQKYSNLAKISSDVLLLLAERVDNIIIGAYDGESFLIWNRLNSDCL